MTTSNDGSRLYIGDTLVVDNDGEHGMGEISGIIPLKAGLYPIRLDYFNSGRTRGLDVTWRGPAFETEPIPDNVLRRLPPASIER